MRNALIWAVLLYFRFWARIALQLHRPTVIGITGSAGKSSARNAIYALLRDYTSVKMIEKGNSETGIPLGILGSAPKDYSNLDWMKLILLAPFGLGYLEGVKYVIAEMGVDDPFPPKNMGYLLTIVKPHIAVFLNALPVHTMQFEKMLPTRKMSDEQKIHYLVTRIAEEKGKIITENENMTTIIYNEDNAYVKQIIDDVKKSVTRLPFGKSSKNPLTFSTYEPTIHGTKFGLIYQEEKITLNFKEYLLPQVYEEVFAAALLVGKTLHLTTENIVSGLSKHFALPVGRSTILKGMYDSIIIDSSYNASARPVLAFLDLVARLKMREKRPVVFLFGDMRELGEEARHEHEEVAKRAFEVADYLYCVGELTKQYIIENPKFLDQREKLKDIKWFKNSKLTGVYVKQNLPENALVLVKGSQNKIFLEEAVKQVLADPRDASKLCRQEEFWEKVKSDFFLQDK